MPYLKNKDRYLIGNDFDDILNIGNCKEQSQMLRMTAMTN